NPTAGTVGSGCSGCLSAGGSFNSATIGLVTVIATNSGVQGATLVNVYNYDVSNAHAYPVPFKSSQGSTICFAGIGSSAKIRIYTSSGRQVFSMDSSTDPNCTWKVENSSGEKLASGVYFYVIESPLGKKNGILIIIQYNLAH